MGLEFETTVVYECRGEAAANVYLVAAPTTDVDREELARFRITGHVVGPTCLYSSTLQARIPLLHRGPTAWGGRPAIAAEAIVPDPCYWSSELPFLYHAVGKIAEGEQDAVPFDDAFGMRAVSIVRNRLALDGKIWVPRCVRRSVVVGDSSLSSWRDTDTTMYAEDPDDQLLDEASRVGVQVIAHIRNPDRELTKRLIRMAKFPAALLAVFEGPSEPEPSVLQNLILAQESSFGPGGTQALWACDQEWSKALVLNSSGERNPYNIAVHVTGSAEPVLVQRNTGKRSLLEARKACDELQADLAEICDPAGYIV